MARTEGLLSSGLLGETILFDQSRMRAFCLNPTVSFVWRHCDGTHSIAEIAALLRKHTQQAADEHAVWLALRKLSRKRLLQTTLDFPEIDLRGRRQMLKTLGLVGAGAAILTVTAPHAYASSTCQKSGASCNRPADCCSTICLPTNHCL